MTKASGEPGGREPQLDNAVPGQGYRMPPALVLCGARGAAAALVPLLSGLPRDSGLAVIVSVDDPELPAALSALEQQGMGVVRVRNPVQVEPDRVFVLPAARIAVLPDGGLLPHDVTQPFPSDFLLRALADVYGAHAAAVVLSGQASDAALGLKRIKERGGLTIAQDPDEAAEPTMPRAAIATGMVDWVLPAAQVRQRLLEYFRLEHLIRLPAEADAAADELAPDETVLRDILTLVRTRTGRDFTHYKRATILRRIGRRMQVNRIESMQDYLAFLRTRTAEAAALLQDVLVSVTNFFRDPECFAALELQVPELFRGKGPGDQVRVWVPACATGEEAYSIAMLLAEHARTLHAPPALQVFASDLDEQALQEARDAVYPATIEADVSPQRLRRFFMREHRGWRIRRELRETVLFAQHDLLKDSPFSRLDLVSCRNLLIYLDRHAQRRVLETLRFALLPHGRLFLGSSESIEDGSPLFTTLDKQHRLYVHRAAARAGHPVAPRATEIGQTLQPDAVDGPCLEQPRRDAREPARRGERPPPASEIHLRLLEQLSPPSVLVNAEHEIVHLSPGAGRYLLQAGGEPTRNLLQVVHPGLRIELRAALCQAAQTRAPVEVGGLAVEAGGTSRPLALRVVPATEVGEDLFLVLFQPAGAESSDSAVQRWQAGADTDPIARHLDRELERLKAHLRDTVEQYEASTEELKASNEELQAMNEELRSATEELETSREELQSINEELTTVNHELKAKIDELAHSNSDMQNLMDATDIATVFLDRDLCITRYTPAAIKLFTLIPTDAGRPLTDLTTRLSYPDLAADARQVLDRLIPIEREVGHQGGAWYLARVLPYRTFEDRIAGVVLSFVDITERRRAEEMRTWLSTVVGSGMDGIISFSLDLTVRSWNPAAERIFGYTAAECIGQSLNIVAPGPQEEEEQRGNMRALARGESLQFEATRARKDRSLIRVAFTVAPIRDGEGRVIGGTSMARDVTETRRAQEALELSQAELTVAMRELEAADKAKDRFMAVLSHELRNPLASMASAVEVLADAGPGTPMRERALGIVRRQTATMRQLLEDLLDVTRLRLGKLSLRPARTSVREVVGMAEDTVRPLVRERGHQLDIDVPSHEVRLHGDKVRIAQVITNLLGNAAKYTPPGGHIRLAAQVHGRELHIAVEDNGIGLDAAELDQVFGLFVQAPHAGEATASGLGIGLALARSIAEMHGGTLRAESEGHGKGSRFVFVLPVEDTPTPPPASPTHEPSAPGAGTLLIVDDNTDALWGLGTVLERAGYRVLTADSGAQGLALGDQVCPDAMLLDIGLPDMTGLELARRVRATAWGARAILIALTGLGQESDVRQSHEAGFDAHLTKPADVAQLRRLLGELRRNASM